MTLSETKPIMVLAYTPGAIKLTNEQAALLFTKEQLASCDNIHGKLKTFGPWGIPINYQALCTSNVWSEAFPHEHGPLYVYGQRTLNNVRQSGYELEGRVSVAGRKWRGFTSSQMFELPNGRLINVATIHACIQ